MSETKQEKGEHGEENNVGIKFEPPLYIQRYKYVYDLIFKQNPPVAKVADFGCAEGKFINYLKALPFADEISAVDIEEDALEECKFKARPNSWDYVFGRNVAMNLNLYRGSVAEKDYRLKYLDAITMIELIEHLSSSVLEKFPANVFGFLKPRIVIITTPNSEFNALFQQLKPGDFRHWDHKFEWSRREFKDWCDSIVAKYPDYAYEIFGVGDALPESKELGPCSQGVLFKRQSEESGLDVTCTPMNYNLLESFSYPARVRKEEPYEEIDWS
ncbi:Small RNA 2'-O-methyltransferase [Halotydeus destructor]|nr:Small RNA 2'-O-methyltransferase [Halotydeus destructor]